MIVHVTSSMFILYSFYIIVYNYDMDLPEIGGLTHEMATSGQWWWTSEFKNVPNILRGIRETNFLRKSQNLGIAENEEANGIKPNLQCWIADMESRPFFRRV